MGLHNLSQIGLVIALFNILVVFVSPCKYNAAQLIPVMGKNEALIIPKWLIPKWKVGAFDPDPITGLQVVRIIGDC